ncbi:hypothetical protein [Avibacterium avium]
MATIECTFWGVGQGLFSSGRVTLSQILCKHPFQLNGDRRGDHQNQ